MTRELPRRLQLHVPADNTRTQQLAVHERKLARDVDAGVHRPVVHEVRVAA